MEKFIKKTTIEPPPEALARAFAALAGDLALVLDTQGQVLAAAWGEDGGAREGADKGADHPAEDERLRPWVGQAWEARVAADSRSKAARLLAEALQTGSSRHREINLEVAGGPPQAMRCSALMLGPQGPVLVVGRALDAQQALQGRLAGVQRELEGAYWRAREALEGQARLG